MKNSLLSSLAFLLLLSCHPGHYKKLRSGSSFPEAMPSPVFGENFSSSLFKANIRIYGKDVSGLLITKQVAPRDYRVIFTTELGIKLFDFGFKDNDFTLYSCVPQFNRPRLLSVIRQDIETLLMNNTLGKQAEHLADEKALFSVFRIAGKPHDLYYFVSRSSGRLERIERGRKNSRKVVYSITMSPESMPSHIFIEHYDMKLTIELNLLKK